MSTRVQLQPAQERSAEMLTLIVIDITSAERKNIEVTEFYSTGRGGNDKFTDPGIRRSSEASD